jgi:phage terminase large subunit-like protein
VPYDIWADEGLLERVEGALITSSPLVQYIVGRDGRSGLLSRFPMLKQGEFGFDPAFASEVAVRLRDDYHLNVVEVPQNYTHLSEACQVFEALVKARRVVHGGNRLMRWCVENLAIKRDDAGRIKPVKPKRVKRIDGAVASIIGLSRLMLMPAARSKSGGVMFV